MASNDRDISKLTPQEQKVLARALFEQWDLETQKMKKASEDAQVDASNVKPSDIGVRFGPVLDEATFREYQKRKHGRLTVISSDQLKNMMGGKK